MSRSFDPDAHACATAAALGLPLDPGHLPGIAANLALAARMAALLEEARLARTDEAAPVFVAGREPPGP